MLHGFILKLNACPFILQLYVTLIVVTVISAVDNVVPPLDCTLLSASPIEGLKKITSACSNLKEPCKGSTFFI